jgi:anthranilate phosphoribosyltransferase
MKNNKILEKLFDSKNLSAHEVQIFIESCINEELTESQIAGFLVGLRMKGETIEEIESLIQAMRKHMISFQASADGIDTCGTGGDRMGTFNISTAVSFVVAGAGVPIVKHGNKAQSSLCGSADVLAELGVLIMLTPQEAKKVFEKVGMIFLFAPLYHPVMKQIAPLRKALGIRTVFNYLGPFLNPAIVKRQIIGVPTVAIAEKLAQVASRLNYEYALIVSSSNGMDEIATNGITTVFEIKGKKVTKNFVDPEALGFKKSSLREIQGGNIQQNAQIIQDILEGKRNAKRDIVILNSAYALVVAGKVKNISEGIKRAEESIDSGAAKMVLKNLIKETKKYE